MSIDLTEYKNISKIIFWSIAINIFCVILLHFKTIDDFLVTNFGFSYRTIFLWLSRRNNCLLPISKQGQRN
jgi:hypothetical protein